MRLPSCQVLSLTKLSGQAPNSPDRVMNSRISVVDSRELKRCGKADISIILLGLIGGAVGGLFVFRAQPANETNSAATEPAAEARTEPVNPPEPVAKAKPQARPRSRIEIARRDRQALLLQNELAELQLSVPRRATGRSESAHTDSEDERPRRRTTVIARPTGAGTLQYWNSLNRIIDLESVKRGRPGRQFDERSAGEFLQRRFNAAQVATEAIQRLNTSEVDPEATKLGNELAQWYDKCKNSAQEGLAVLESDSKSRRGSAGQEWQLTERQLTADVAKINRSAAALRKSLTRRYRMNFPALH